MDKTKEKWRNFCIMYCLTCIQIHQPICNVNTKREKKGNNIQKLQFSYPPIGIFDNFGSYFQRNLRVEELCTIVKQQENEPKYGCMYLPLSIFGMRFKNFWFHGKYPIGRLRLYVCYTCNILMHVLMKNTLAYS